MTVEPGPGSEQYIPTTQIAGDNIPISVEIANLGVDVDVITEFQELYPHRQSRHCVYHYNCRTAGFLTHGRTGFHVFVPSTVWCWRHVHSHDHDQNTAV